MAETVRADETGGRAGPRLVRHSQRNDPSGCRGDGQCGHRDRRTQPTGTPDPRGAETRTTRTGDLRVPPLHRVATRGYAWLRVAWLTRPENERLKPHLRVCMGTATGPGRIHAWSSTGVCADESHQSRSPSLRHGTRRRAMAHLSSCYHREPGAIIVPKPSRGSDPFTESVHYH